MEASDAAAAAKGLLATAAARGHTSFAAALLHLHP